MIFKLIDFIKLWHPLSLKWERRQSVQEKPTRNISVSSLIVCSGFGGDLVELVINIYGAQCWLTITTMYVLHDWPCGTSRRTWSLRCIWPHRSSRPRRGPVWSEPGSGSCLPAAASPDTGHSAPHTSTSVGPRVAVIPVEAKIFRKGALAYLASFTWRSRGSRQLASMLASVANGSHCIHFPKLSKRVKKKLFNGWLNSLSMVMIG